MGHYGSTILGLKILQVFTDNESHAQKTIRTFIRDVCKCEEQLHGRLATFHARMEWDWIRRLPSQDAGPTKDARHETEGTTD